MLPVFRLLSVLFFIYVLLFLPKSESYRVNANEAVGPVVSTGPGVLASHKAAVRYRNFSSGAGTEIMLGIPPLPSSSQAILDFHGANDCDGVKTYGAWSGRNQIIFHYSPLSGKIYTQVHANYSYCVEHEVGDLGTMNIVQVEVYSRHSGANVSLENAALNGQPLPDFGVTSPASQTWQITGVDLTEGFTLQADLVLTGTQPTSQELNRVELKAGYYDDIAPSVENLQYSSEEILPGQPVRLTGQVSDILTGGSKIIAAEYSLNHGAWQPMQADDGTFDDPEEFVTASIVPIFGDNQACVRGKDVNGNVGEPVCIEFFASYPYYFPIISNHK